MKFNESILVPGKKEAGTAAPPDQLAAYPGFLLSWVAEAGRQHYAKALQRVDLETHHVGVLELVQAQQPVVQARIGEQLGIFKPVMVTLINELETRGLVQRKPHPRDKRAVEIHLTREGAKMIEEIRQISAKASDTFFAGLSEREHRRFHELLGKLARSLKDADEKNG